MNTTRAISPARRIAVHVLCTTLLAAWTVPADAETPIDVIPMSVQNRAPPNLMYTLDNSGSMQYPYMPDTSLKFALKNCYKNSAVNTLYYDPNQKYVPPKRADGSSFRKANFDEAYVDGYDLTAQYSPAGKGQYGTSRLFGSQARNADNTVLKSSAPFKLGVNFMAGFDHIDIDAVPLYNSEGKKQSDWYYDQPQPAYYYRYIGTDPQKPVLEKCYDDGKYQKVVIGDDQKQNFANWFTYYRTRMLLMKTTLSLSFATLDSTIRVGFSTINDNDENPNTTGVNFLPVRSFDHCAGCGKDLWYRNLFALKPSGGTPLRSAMKRVGEYYRTGRFPGVSGGTADPLLPSVASCQRNFQIISTDGYWSNENDINVGNRDETMTGLPAAVDDKIAGVRLTNGRLPPPFHDDRGISDSMADLAMYYWATNLRPNLEMLVPPTARDTAIWPHMTTYSISLGEGGTLTNDNATERDLIAGRTQWPTPVAQSATAIDDVWHAALNGHGDFITARQAGDLQDGLNRMLADIGGGTYAGSAIAVSNHEFDENTLSNNKVFSATYDPGNWTGNLTAYTLNFTSNTLSLSEPLWNAQATMKNRPWSNRRIYAFDGDKGVPFTAADLGGKRGRLNTPGKTDAANVVNFLRGDRSLESIDYRTRSQVLGDIINAEPVYVGENSKMDYGDPGYATFRAAARTPMVYQGANDGMLHAFVAATGGEQWAYVPGLLIDRPYVTTTSPGAPAVDQPNTSSLVNLSSASNFTHLPYVDAAPVVNDVDLNHTRSSKSTPKWITMLVGGLGKGGRGYYALNVTKPTGTIDLVSRDKLVRWEFPNDATSDAVRKNIGYGFGKPIIVKTSAHGWVVLVTSGYNNGSESTGGDGKGRLFVLDANTGELIKELVTTNPVDPKFPSGLAHISAYVEAGKLNKLTDFVYGGDLYGNLWRFDLRSKDDTKWTVKRLATLVNAEGDYQPITTYPELGRTDSDKRIVYIGTGKYLSLRDIPGTENSFRHSTQKQTFYGLVDDETVNPTINSSSNLNELRGKLVRQTLAKPSLVDYDSKKGWYMDFEQPYERLVRNPVYTLGTLSFVTNVPSTDQCRPGGKSYLYALDAPVGVKLRGLNWSSTQIGNSLSGGPVPIRVKGRRFDLFQRESTGKPNGADLFGKREVEPPPTGTAKQRTLWREIITGEERAQ